MLTNRPIIRMQEISLNEDYSILSFSMADNYLLVLSEKGKCIWSDSCHLKPPEAIPFQELNIFFENAMEVNGEKLTVSEVSWGKVHKWHYAIPHSVDEDDNQRSATCYYLTNGKKIHIEEAGGHAVVLRNYEQQYGEESNVVFENADQRVYPNGATLSGYY